MNEVSKAKVAISHLPEDVQADLARWVEKYPPTKRQSAVLPVMLRLQEHLGGWLPEPWLEAVAEYLQISSVAVFEVATFYTMFFLSPVGKNVLCVCTNISCALCGSKQIVDHIKKKLQIDFGQTTADGLFTLKEVECLGACAGAPAMMVGKNYYEHLSPEKIDALLDTWRHMESKDGQ